VEGVDVAACWKEHRGAGVAITAEVVLVVESMGWDGLDVESGSLIFLEIDKCGGGSIISTLGDLSIFTGVAARGTS
jgi:hypothetical protein